MLNPPTRHREREGEEKEHENGSKILTDGDGASENVCCLL